MAFVQITDPDKAMELYRAGLLWEQYHDDVITVPACGWARGPLRSHVERRDAVFTFYILLED